MIYQPADIACPVEKNNNIKTQPNKKTQPNNEPLYTSQTLKAVKNALRIERIFTALSYPSNYLGGVVIF